MTTEWGVIGEAAEHVADQLEGYLSRPDAQGLLHKYFDRAGAFSGPWFDYVDRSAHSANEVGCHDLVAITMLGETIPGLLARDLLCEEAFRTDVSARLSDTPDVDLWEADDDALEAANETWDLIRAQAHIRQVGMGRTKTSKLLARKRPRLVPITDGSFVLRSRCPLGPTIGPRSEPRCDQDLNSWRASWNFTERYQVRRQYRSCGFSTRSFG